MKSIGLLFGVGLAGVFVGALTMEIIHRVRPNLIKEGYHGTGSDVKKLSENS
jgi:hypothetical protein